MLSLVWKDFVVARRFLPLLLPVGVVQLTVLASIPPIYPIAALSFAMLLATGSIVVEESQRTESLLNSLPVTRGELVTARYVSSLLGTTAGLALGWVVAQLAARPIAADAFGPTMFTSLSAHGFMFGAMMLSLAVFLPLHFRFGPGRAVLLFLAVAVAVIMIVSLLAQLLLLAKGYPSPISDPDGWRAAAAEVLGRATEWTAARLGRLLASFVAISSCALGVSWSISRRLYESRDI